MSNRLTYTAVGLMIVALMFVFGAAQEPVTNNGLPSINDATGLEKTKATTVQILIEYRQKFRKLNWVQETRSFPRGKPEKCQQNPEQEDCQEIVWRVTRERWVNIATDENGNRFETTDAQATVRVSCSGTIVFSGFLERAGKLEEKTNILTNYHCVVPFTKGLGTAIKPIMVFAEEDIRYVFNPPSVLVREGSRPTGEYYTIPTNKITIRHRIGQTYEVFTDLEFASSGPDVALLEIDNVSGLPYAVFRNERARVGERIIIGGAPLGYPFSYDFGTINQIGFDLNVVQGGISFNNQIKYDAPTAPGSSGSGLRDADGLLVGLVHAGLLYNGSIVEGGKLAVDGVEVKEVLMWSGFAYIINQQAFDWSGYAAR